MRNRNALLTCLVMAAALLASACAHEAPLPPKAVLLNTAGAQALARGDLESAEASLSVAIEYSPRFVEAWVNLGYVELRRGSFDQARRDFLEARALNRDLPAPHHALGVLAEAQGKGPDAESSYRDALRVDPGFAPSRSNLARRLFGRGQYENAREQFQRLREVAPGAAEGWAGEAESLLRLDREAEADAVVADGPRPRGKRAGATAPSGAPPPRGRRMGRSRGDPRASHRFGRSGAGRRRLVLDCRGPSGQGRRRGVAGSGTRGPRGESRRRGRPICAQCRNRNAVPMSSRMTPSTRMTTTHAGTWVPGISMRSSS